MGAKERFHILDVFRGIFASFVFLFHLRPFAKGSIIDNAFVSNADLFVDFFFILSGFVIAINYSDLNTTSEIKQFLKKRFLRIYPLHLVMLLVFVLIKLVKGSLSAFVHVNNLNDVENNLGSFFSSLFLLHSTPMLNSAAVSWNIPSWSISAEMIAYLVFALFMLLSVSKISKSSRSLIPYVILITSTGLLVYFTKSMRIDYTFDYGFLRGIIGFYVGIITYYTYNFLNRYGIRNLGSTVLSICELIVIGVVIISIVYANQFKSFGLFYELIFSVCILVYTFEGGIVSQLLGKSQFLKNLGKYSYSIYMTHALMISLFNIVFIRLLS